MSILTWHEGGRRAWVFQCRVTSGKVGFLKL
jgi:hypothetical protein